VPREAEAEGAVEGWEKLPAELLRKIEQE